MRQKKNNEFYCSECNDVVNEADLVCQKCGADLSEIINEKVFLDSSKKNSHFCDYCKTEKNGILLEWYEVYNNTNRGVDLIGLYFYKCNACGDIICNDCKKAFIKTSVRHGWAKGICPSCLSTFNPLIMPELERGRKEKTNLLKTQEQSFVMCKHCDKEVNSKFTYCNHCGKEIIKPKVCEQCKIIIDWDADFCPQCGDKIKLKDENNKEIIKNEAINNSIEWYYELNGKREGPVYQADIISLFENDILNGESLILKRGANTWVQIKDTEFDKFIPHNESLPLPSSDNIENTYVWLVAFFPIIIDSVVLVLSVFPEIEKILNTELWDNWYLARFVALFIILVLVETDIKKLKKSGYKPPSSFWLILLPPIYLWKRAVVTKQPKNYFWVSTIIILIYIFIYSLPLILDNYEHSDNNTYTNNIVYDEYVNMVKTGTFNSYPNHTIDKAVSSFFDNPRWEQITAADGYIYVNMRGGMSYNSNPVDALLQFSIIEDNTFEVNAFEINGIPQNQLVINDLIAKMFASIP